jgi:hypothetical protein
MKICGARSPLQRYNGPMARRENPSLARTALDLAQYIGLRAVSGFIQCFDVEQNLHTARARRGEIDPAHARADGRGRDGDAAAAHA